MGGDKIIRDILFCACNLGPVTIPGHTYSSIINYLNKITISVKTIQWPMNKRFNLLCLFCGMSS